MKRFYSAVLPAFLLAVSVGQIYAFTKFSSEIAAHIGRTQADVQWAFSFGIFFLGMGAAFFGKIVEKNIRLSTIIGTTLFLSGLFVTELGINMKSLATIYLGYGLLIGLGTGIIYISPVKTMMLWFPEHKAIAAALPIISFGLGSTLSAILCSGIHWGTPGESVAVFHLKGFMDYGITNIFHAYAIFYAVPMVAACFLLKKPKVQVQSFGHGIPSLEFSYGQFLCNRFFWQAWLFMFLNISAGLSLIPLAQQMMSSPDVYGDNRQLINWIVALAGVMNGGGRFIFAWWSDRLARRINILLVILAISAGIMLASYVPILIGLALLVINACYGAGFSVIPAILADHFGMTNISKIHGAVLSAWGVAGIIGNQAALKVSGLFGGYADGGHGYVAVVTMLVAVYSANIVNVCSLRRAARLPARP